MASKKASASAPVAAAIASASDGAVSGPVAMIAWSQSSGGRPATSSRAMVISGCASIARRDRRRKAVAVDGERAAGRHLVAVAGAHDQRSGKPHLGMQQADRIGLGVVGAEGIGADQFGEAVGLVRLGAAHGAHLVQHDGHAGFGDLPRSFRAGEAAADDVDGVEAHAPGISPGRREKQISVPGNDNTRRGRRSGGCRFFGQRSGGGESWPYPSGSGRR